jgi:hypothetical protein
VLLKWHRSQPWRLISTDRPSIQNC